MFGHEPPDQPHLPLGNIASRVPTGFLPRAELLPSGNKSFLASLLHRQQGSSLRNGDCSKLLERLRDGNIIVRDIHLPFRPNLSDEAIDAMLPANQRGRYSAGHRRLVMHGYILARAIFPLGEFIPEAPTTPSPMPLRCDIGVSHSNHPLTAIEAGATDGARIVAMLDRDVQSVIVLPFASLFYSVIGGYVFSKMNCPLFKTLSGDDGRRALQAIASSSHAPSIAA